jgi:hypothetical protein
MNIYFYFYFNITRDVVTVLLIFVDIYHLNHKFAHAHIEAHTHKRTCVISAQEEQGEPDTGAWLGGVKKGVCKRQRPSTQ